MQEKTKALYKVSRHIISHLKNVYRLPLYNQCFCMSKHDRIHMYLGEEGLCYSQVKFFCSCFYHLQ